MDFFVHPGRTFHRLPAIARATSRALLLLITASTAVAATPATPATPPADKPAAATTTPAINALTRAAVDAGALTCARRVNDLANYLSQGAAQGGRVFADPAAPDQRPLSLSMELAGSGQSAYVGATFSPRTGGCDATYEAVVWWPESCSDVARKHFAGLAPRPPLQKQVQSLDGGDALKVFLMPAGSGCVSIKKEMVRQGP